tara:strand:- start:109 stop:786 length:678 start_codon:yes stop_codon:yes gene_type:complete
MIFKKLKRFLDIIFSVLVIVLFAPVLVLVCFFSMIINGLPVFYISNRMVSEKKLIKIVKFRSMVKDAKSSKYNLAEKYMKNGYLDIPLTAEVFTPYGRFLENTQLVELPQVFAVLFGYISFVGNRPLPENNVDILREEFPKDWQKRFDSPAGLTGISQVVGKLSLSPKQRLELEGLYSRVYNEGNIIKVDLYVIISTIKLILIRKPSAYRSFKTAKLFLESCIKK